MKIYKIAQTQRQLTVQDSGVYGEMIPIVTIRGKWLMAAGFYPKDRVAVSVSDKSITLSVVEENTDSRERHQEILRNREEKERMMREKGNKINIPRYPNENL